MTVAVVLYGPKAAGKSQVAEALHQTYGVRPLDADEIVLGLLFHGAQPDSHNGWLIPIERAVMAALRDSVAVSIEATGAWDSDWQLAQDLRTAGVRVLRVWVCAPLAMTLDRLARRVTRKVPTTQGSTVDLHDSVCPRPGPDLRHHPGHRRSAARPDPGGTGTASFLALSIVDPAMRRINSLS